MIKFQTLLHFATLLSLSASYLILEECNKECHDCYIEYSGDNLDNPVDSFEGGPKACQALCASTSGCKFFTWRNAGTCLLKTKIGNKNPNLNAISGPMMDKCSAVAGGWSEWSEWEVCPQYGGNDCTADGSSDTDNQVCNEEKCPVCVYEGTEYTGMAYLGMNPYLVSTFDDCYDDFVQKNKKDPSCRYFTFRMGDGDAGTCLLKHWKGNANPNVRAISGTTKC